MTQIADWLETHWVTPAYSGWVLIGIAVCFFGAAVNSMAGWLYVLSGVSFALLGIAAVLPVRSLLGLDVYRHPIEPVTVGDQLTVKLAIHNQTNQLQTLLQIQDILPFVLGQPVQAPIEMIPPHSSHHWIYYHLTTHRGVYRWHTVQLRTATPLGLFWCRRRRSVAATAIVYPTVLSLSRCPLIDAVGQENNPQFHNLRTSHLQASTAGLTRSLRPYRLGDPTRLIHWRSSARYGEFRVRELEVIRGGQEIVICLDTTGSWHPDTFEQAVIAAASLYFYAQRQQMHVKLWTASTGLVQGDRIVLETLATTTAAENLSDSHLPNHSLLWLSQNSLSLNTLPPGSRWILWQTASSQPQMLVNQNLLGITIDQQRSLQLQMQQSLS